MDNSILYTRCPTCSTAFKVTDELLAIAGGKVRCGACLAIFQASDYMLEPAKKARTTESEDNLAQERTDTSISEFLQQKSEMNQPEPEAVQPEDDSEVAKSESTAFSEEYFHNEADVEASEEELKESLEFEALEEEIMQTPEVEEPQLSFEEEFDIEGDAVNQQESSLQNEFELVEPDLEVDDAIDDEINDSEDFGSSFEIEPGNQNNFNEENALAFDEYDANETDMDDFGNESELAEQINAQIEDVKSDPDPLDEFNEIVENHRSGIRPKLIIAAVTLFLIIALFQIWSNRQAIAWSDTWGPMMKTACNALPCKLKPKRAINQIKLLQRQVSPHQEKEKTLDIKVLLVNQANFAQPYPVIKIAFSDKNGKEVAVKRFKPSNYLRNGSKNELMPQNAEVHIQFDTKTPHPDALGFEFIFE